MEASTPNHKSTNHTSDKTTDKTTDRVPEKSTQKPVKSIQPASDAVTFAINKRLAAIFGLILLLILTFSAGMQYQKHHSAPALSASATRGQFNTYGGGIGGPGRGTRMGGGFGTVTAVSDSSITIDNQRSGSSQTFTISSSTTVTNNGASSTVSAIKTGDTVFVRTSGSGSTAATSIDDNPSFDSPAAGSQQQSSPTDNSTQSTNSST